MGVRQKCNVCMHAKLREQQKQQRLTQQQHWHAVKSPKMIVH